MATSKPTVLKGKLEAFFETGTEGVIWSFVEDGKSGYDGLHPLKKGDLLRVFNDATEQKTLFDGKIDLEYKRRWKPYPLNPKYGQQEVFGYWVHGFQKGVTPKLWAKMFFDQKPAELILPPSPPPGPTKGNPAP